jgi:membrane fusion protein, copper/silver efflux system
MKTTHFVLALAAASLLGAGAYGLYWVGMNRGMNMAGTTSGVAPAGGGEQAMGASDRKILYWHDPMVPGQKFDKPGKSPFMDMPLVPVYADGDGGDGGVRISPRVQQNLGVRTAEVSMGTLGAAVEAVGTVAYNERDLALVQARSNGYVEKLHVRATLDAVRKGQALAELYVPEWVAVQEEYLSARRLSGTRLEALVDGARQRMRLAGMSEEQIMLVESTGKVHPRFVVAAPISGVVAELGAREGMTVMAGATLFRINGLATVWVNAEVREAQASTIRPGNRVEARAPALPGVVFEGRVSALLPEVNLATRTIKARVELANPGAQLVPGMFATINFAPAERKQALLVPAEAVIQTGSRSVVIVAQGDGRFAAVDVEVGNESGGQTEIRKGLEAGQKIVVSAQFLIDSEASLRGTATRLGEVPATANAAAIRPTHRGEGRIERIGKEAITISHGAIPTLKWEPMTMDFKLPASGISANIAAGDSVAFEIRENQEGMFEITALSLAATGHGEHDATGTGK